jgi:DNA polymerase (family 10)
MVVTPSEHGSALFYGTGTAAHVAAIRARGLTNEAFASEESLYASVGLAFVPPELRHGLDEIEKAADGALPALVAVADIRGDLHMHTTYSDGRDPLLSMVEAASTLGYEFVAITDHSEGASASRTLAIDDIQRQREDIADAAAAFPHLTILHGVEVDILPTGRLDFPDDVLEQFDIVLASLHEHAHQAPARLTARSLDAIRHPLVNVLCHPANQFPGATRGYALDFDKLYAAAAETGTALEIDGSPSHMDLDDRRARAAAAAGVTLAVDSDCHRTTALGRQMRFAVGIARRAGLGKESVLNTQSVEQIRAFVADKRRGGRGPA